MSDRTGKSALDKNRGRFCRRHPYGQFAGDRLIMRDFLAIDRTILANERTFLAYCRTSLALALTGAGYMRFIRGPSHLMIGLGLIALGLVTAIIGIWRTVLMNRRITAAAGNRAPSHDDARPGSSGASETTEPRSRSASQ